MISDCNQLVSVIAEDKAGNRVGPEVITFDIDKTPPVVSELLYCPVYYAPCLNQCTIGCANVNVSFSATDNKTTCAELPLAISGSISGSSINCSYQTSVCWTPGGYSVTATATDKCNRSDNGTNTYIVYPPYGCDCPDETESVSTIVASPQEVEGISIIGVFSSGLHDRVKAILSTFGEPVEYILPETSLSQLKEYKALILPSGGLMGMEKSEIYKTLLDEYVKQGGIILSFTQQHGYEFSALPGGQVSGYGSMEDQSCQANAAQIDEYHQILASQKDLRFDGGIDGYFTLWPRDAKVLLRRTKNNMPALILYPYGQGYVIATTLYSDFSYAQGSITQDELDLNLNL